MDSLHNIEAEMWTLGAVLLDPAEAGRLRPEEYHDKRHQLIAQALLDLAGRNEPLDLVMATTELQRQGRLAEAGGSAYLALLVDYAPTAANIGHHLRLVRETYLRRRLVEKSREIAQAAREAESAAEALDRAESSLLELRSVSRAASGPAVVSRLLAPAFKRLERLHQSRGEVAGIPTGYADLDRMTCGLQPGDLIIIAGRPSMGKTALGLNIAENAATAGHRTLVFSLEMSKEQLVTRLIASNGRVDAQRLRSGQFSDADWNKMTDAAQRISATPLLIDDAPSPTSLDIRAASRRVMRDGGLALIVVDYLQLMRPVKQHSIREREVAEFSRSLKALAKELHVPVVILAQLNRALEAGATPRRPVMSDLRESGSLEQDADLILFPWREAAYCQACRQKNDDCGARHYRQAEIIIGKQRNGPVGTVPMAWLPEFCRFEGLEAPVPGR